MVTASTENWQQLRDESRQALPDQLRGAELPDVLLDYQRELLAATASRPVVVVEKSRRIGATWGVAADAVLSAGAARSAHGQDVFYIGYNRDMTREFIDTCAAWSKAFAVGASRVDEFTFRDGGSDGERDIQAFRISFRSGFEIVALCSRPRSLRGRQGYVIIDEAAFHEELEELLKAALALLMWGGKVLVISTHDGADNAFAELVGDCRAGKRPYKLLRVTFDDALRDGLYRRICLVKGTPWTAEAEAAWAAEIRALYGDAASEELDCIPRKSGGKWLSRAMLEARASADIPILRWSAGDEFVDMTDAAREAECQAWCEEQVKPLLAKLPADRRGFLGVDFGRSGDLSIFWPLVLETDLRRHTPFVVELRNIPFREQEHVLRYLCERLPRFSGAALDARGNGQYLAERARQIYGSQTVAEVMLSEGWYREHMPRLKAALEDSQLDLPADADTLDDLRALEVIRGVPRVPDARTQGATGQRHGDAAVGLALAMFASALLDGGSTDFVVDGTLSSLEGYGHEDLGSFEGFQ